MSRSADASGGANAIEDAERAETLDRLERALGIRLQRRELLEAALRHSSYAHEAGEGESNERLEFLGDAVLALVVADALYRAKPDWQEGELTRSLHALVEGRSLEKLARGFGVGPALQLGRTEQSSGGAEKPSILANAMEALIGAIYLDGGIDVARAFIEGAFAEALAADAPPVRRDPKTELQERSMASKGEFPSYQVVVDSAIEGDDERFTVEVLLLGERLAEGVGRTKRLAERRAAVAALGIWRDDDPAERGGS